MADIRIWFLKNGGIDVFRDPQPVVSGETIAWHIISENLEVREVLISFVNPHEGFFTGVRGATSYMLRLLDPASRSTVIWGIAPRFADSPHYSKYTIEGMKVSGDSERLDPVIIIEPPGPGVYPVLP